MVECVQDRPDKKAETLYDTDFYVWCNEQARLVRERRFAELDLENVAEELESMGRSDKRQIESRLEVLIAHLLKWKFQPGARTPRWRGTISEQRRRIARVAEESPSLKGYPAATVLDVYESARIAAADETGIDYTLFPDACPFTPEEILDPDFLPKQAE
jgi:hypothetical protein